jgi:nitric oxide reductase activation protein
MVYYSEWDNKLDDYKREWCRVREMDMPETSPSLFYDRAIEEHYGMVSLLRRYFGLLRPDRIQRFFREERGDDIDFDALIESVVDRHAGITPSDAVYIRREKNLRDVSVAFLVDMSYSTGDVLPSGKRIIDVEREGLVLMAEALESLGDQWAVYGFSTSRRALWEGRRKGVSFFCITVDKKSRDYLPYMYGESNYILIENLDTLPTMLPLIYKRLTT